MRFILYIQRMNWSGSTRSHSHLYLILQYMSWNATTLKWSWKSTQTYRSWVLTVPSPWETRRSFSRIWNSGRVPGVTMLNGKYLSRQTRRLLGRRQSLAWSSATKSHWPIWCLVCPCISSTFGMWIFRARMSISDTFCLIALEYIRILAIMLV